MVIGFRIGAANKKVMASGTATPRTTSPRANGTFPALTDRQQHPKEGQASAPQNRRSWKHAEKHPLRYPKLHHHRKPNTQHHKRQRLDQHTNRKSDEILQSVGELNRPRRSHSDRKQDGDSNHCKEPSAHIENRSGTRLRSVRSRPGVD